MEEAKDDLISRQEAIDALIERDANCGLDSAEVIKALPSAQPERPKGKWIPVDSYSAFGGDEATWMTHGNPVAFYYCSE